MNAQSSRLSFSQKPAAIRPALPLLFAHIPTLVVARREESIPTDRVLPSGPCRTRPVLSLQDPEPGSVCLYESSSAMPRSTAIK